MYYLPLCVNKYSTWFKNSLTFLAFLTERSSVRIVGLWPKVPTWWCWETTEGNRKVAGKSLPVARTTLYRGSNGVGTEDFIFSANFFSQFNKPQKARFVI